MLAMPKRCWSARGGAPVATSASAAIFSGIPDATTPTTSEMIPGA